MTDIPSVLLDYIRGLKTHDLHLVAHAVADDLRFVLPDRQLDKSQFLDMLGALYTAFPDWRYEHQSPKNTRDGFVIQWRQSGTHLGEFALSGETPIEPTGRVVSIPDQYFSYQLGDGKIVEIRPDPVPGGAPYGILAQIGARTSDA